MDGIDYLGGDFKMYVSMEAPGFNMMTDEWEVILKVGGRTLLTIPKSEALVDDQDNFYVAVKGAKLKEGQLDVVLHAMVPDDDFEDGIRNEIDKHYKLTNLRKP